MLEPFYLSDSICQPYPLATGYELKLGGTSLVDPDLGEEPLQHLRHDLRRLVDEGVERPERVSDIRL